MMEPTQQQINVIHPPVQSTSNSTEKHLSIIRSLSVSFYFNNNAICNFEISFFFQVAVIVVTAITFLCGIVNTLIWISVAQGFWGPLIVCFLFIIDIKLCYYI